MAYSFYEAIIAPRYATATWEDWLVFGCFFTGAFLCLGMSATYHAICNHSPDVAKWGNKLDYTGIVCLIMGSYMPAMYYGFYCLPKLLELYLALVSNSKYTPNHRGQIAIILPRGMIGGIASNHTSSVRGITDT